MAFSFISHRFHQEYNTECAFLSDVKLLGNRRVHLLTYHLVIKVEMAYVAL